VRLGMSYRDRSGLASVTSARSVSVAPSEGVRRSNPTASGPSDRGCHKRTPSKSRCPPFWTGLSLELVHDAGTPRSGLRPSNAPSRRRHAADSGVADASIGQPNSVGRRCNLGGHKPNLQQHPAGAEMHCPSTLWLSFPRFASPSRIHAANRGPSTSPKGHRKCTAPLPIAVFRTNRPFAPRIRTATPGFTLRRMRRLKINAPSMYSFFCARQGPCAPNPRAIRRFGDLRMRC